MGFEHLKQSDVVGPRESGTAEERMDGDGADGDDVAAIGRVTSKGDSVETRLGITHAVTCCYHQSRPDLSQHLNRKRIYLNIEFSGYSYWQSN